jgi:hypothetical protein
LTDFLNIPIWFILSWLIRQVENGISVEDERNEEEGEGNATSTSAAEQESAIVSPDEPYEPLVQLIKIGIAAFSVLLLGLSITAYRRTALKRILYAALAFGLFAAQLFFDYAEDAIEGWEQPYNDVIYYAMTLAILVLFFVTIVRKNTITAK